MTDRDYVRCIKCETRICYDGHDTVRDALEARWGNPESPVWTEGLGLLCPDCTNKLQSRLAAWGEWGERVEEAFLDDGTDLCDLIQSLLHDRPEVGDGP